MKIIDVYEGREEFVYICPLGMTVEVIAEKFGIPVQKILSDNGIDDVEVGDEIIIKRGSGRYYRVLLGDTAKSISEKFGVDEKDVLADNGGYVFPAQMLYLRVKEKLKGRNSHIETVDNSDE